MSTAVSIWLAAVLGTASALKLRGKGEAAAGLATYGIYGARAQGTILLIVTAAELGSACGLLVGAPWAAAAAAVLFGAFSLASLFALLAGRGGRPCACFGSASRLGWWTPASSAGLTSIASVAALGWLPSAPTRYDNWLTAGFSVLLLLVIALALAVLALAREIGVLRMQAREQGALEILEEGPELGHVQPWAVSVPGRPGAVLRLAIFTSDGCPLCRRVVPAVDHFAADPLLAVKVLDEATDALIWAQAGVPGSPYAVALDLEGVALAKGTFNGLAQLESILATARTRERRGTLVA
jgi:hypothetical protein